MSRFVVNSNNLWLSSLTDKTIKVYQGPYAPDLNTQAVPGNLPGWKQVARIGANRHCTHRELEVFGVVFNAQKVQELWNGIVRNQRVINREGFMLVWITPGGGTTHARANSVLRRLNDLYDWSKHGVKVALPVQTKWDRFELTTGKVMVGAGEGAGGDSAQMKKDLEEKEKENQRLQAEKDKEIEELKKQAKEKEDAAKKENEELKKQVKEATEKEDAANKENEELKKQVKEKDDQLAANKDELAAKDKQISNLKNALASFT